LPGLDGLVAPVKQVDPRSKAAAPDKLAKDKLAPRAATPVKEATETKTSTMGTQHDGQVAATQAAAAPASATAAPAPASAESTQSIHTDYQKAMKEATESRKMLFVYFYDTKQTAARRAFETLSLAATENQEKLKGYVRVDLPRDAKITSGGKAIELLKHPAFAEMLGRSGVAIVDLAHEKTEYFGHVVSTFPFTPGQYYNRQALSVILSLPPGTLTQRTMIYAVRIHPEAPKSTQGQFHTALADEADSHANYQASIQVQGHHSWDSRFHRINSKLPGGTLAQEVVAESWPNESLVEACVECVDSWRQSPGHWSAVRSRHPLFGYDIKRGRNGIWYATGILASAAGNRRVSEGARIALRKVR
jgi:hypothetical protein